MRKTICRYQVVMKVPGEREDGLRLGPRVHHRPGPPNRGNIIPGRITTVGEATILRPLPLLTTGKAKRTFLINFIPQNRHI